MHIHVSGTQSRLAHLRTYASTQAIALTYQHTRLGMQGEKVT